MAGDASAVVPEGFTRFARSSPFLDLLGPVFHRSTDEVQIYALRIEPRHLNSRGTAHGGVLATLCDVALGYGTAYTENPPLPLSTVQLCTDFFAPVAPGEWLEAQVAVERVGRQLAFATCHLMAGGQKVGAARAIFSRPADYRAALPAKSANAGPASR